MFNRTVTKSYIRILQDFTAAHLSKALLNWNVVSSLSCRLTLMRFSRVLIANLFLTYLDEVHPGEPPLTVYCADR